MNDRQAAKWAYTRSKGPLRFITIWTLSLAAGFVACILVCDYILSAKPIYTDSIKRFPILFPMLSLALIAFGGCVLWIYGEWQYKRYAKKTPSTSGKARKG